MAAKKTAAPITKPSKPAKVESAKPAPAKKAAPAKVAAPKPKAKAKG